MASDPTDIYSFINRQDLTKEYKKYYIEDNGGIDFIVKVNSERMKIYRKDEEIKEIEDPDDLEDDLFKYFTILEVEITDFDGYWPGFDPCKHNKNSELCSCGCGDHGLSLLVQMDKYDYVHIGICISRFSTKELIKGYESFLGNNRVVYSLAFSENNLYFFNVCFNVDYIAYKDLPIKADPLLLDDLYDYYFKEKNKNINTVKTIKTEMIAERPE